jgi:hypothetical protein
VQTSGSLLKNKRNHAAINEYHKVCYRPVVQLTLLDNFPKSSSYNVLNINLNLSWKDCRHIVSFPHEKVACYSGSIHVGT